MKRKLFSVYVLMVVIFLNVGCSKDKNLAELEKTLNVQNVETYLNYMKYCVVDSNNPDIAVDFFEKNEFLSDNFMARIFYSTGLCQKAGNSKTPSEQLKYVRKGMHEFESLVMNYPENPRVYVWQAITYSNFPDILGADEIVVNAIEKALLYNDAAIESDKLVEAELKQLVFSYVNLAVEFNNPTYADKAKEISIKLHLDNDQDVINSLNRTKRIKK